MSSSIYSLAGRVGGFARAARYDGREMTAAARETFIASFRDGHQCRVCPETTLPADLLPEERARRAEALRRAHYARVALASSAARRAKATQRDPLADVPTDPHRALAKAITVFPWPPVARFVNVNDAIAAALDRAGEPVR